MVPKRSRLVQGAGVPGITPLSWRFVVGVEFAPAGHGRAAMATGDLAWRRPVERLAPGREEDKEEGRRRYRFRSGCDFGWGNEKSARRRSMRRLSGGGVP